MDVLIERCAGLDVHKRTVVATIRSPGVAGHAASRDAVVRRRPTAGLLAPSSVAIRRTVTHVAMESTGVYWRPVYAVARRPRCTVLLVNPRAVKHVPGRKTDVRDSDWLAQLLECGLLRGQLHPAAADSGSPRSDPVSKGADSRTGAPCRIGSRRRWSSPRSSWDPSSPI